MTSKSLPALDYPLNLHLLPGSQLAAPEVPLSPMQDPPGVGQLNPMSIWTIQNFHTLLDPPAASPTNPPAQTHDEEVAMMMAAWMPLPQSAMRASSCSFASPPPVPGQFLPPHLFPSPLGTLDTSGGILGESPLQGGGVQEGLDPGSPLSYSAPTMAPLSPHTLPGAQSHSTSWGPMAAAATGLSPEPPPPSPPQQPPPSCPKSAPGPASLGDPHFGTRDASSHGLLGKRLAEGDRKGSPAGSSASALPDAPVQPSPVTFKSLQGLLDNLGISILRNLKATDRKVDALEKRILTLERWRAETEGRQQLP